MVPGSFSVDFFGFLKFRIMSSANRDILTIFLPICIPFISFSCPTALARNYRMMLNSGEESGHLCLVPEFRGNGFSFLIKYDVGYVFVIYSLYYVEVHSCSSYFP
jgi:hypothetical protein